MRRRSFGQWQPRHDGALAELTCEPGLAVVQFDDFFHDVHPQSRAGNVAAVIGASEWAAAEQLIERGGEMVKRLLIVQKYRQDDNSETFRNFTEANCRLSSAT